MDSTNIWCYNILVIEGQPISTLPVVSPLNNPQRSSDSTERRQPQNKGETENV